MQSSAFLKPRIINVEPINPFHAKVVMEPFERGYGHTLGNALRRVLLSSLQGAAVTSIKIDNVLHEGAMRRRFHAEPIIQATELLLQERTPRDVVIARPRAARVWHVPGGNRILGVQLQGPAREVDSEITLAGAGSFRSIFSFPVWILETRWGVTRKPPLARAAMARTICRELTAMPWPNVRVARSTG